MILKRIHIGITIVLLTAPSMALAHLVNSGLGPIYDGALHLLLSPGDLLGLLAAALLSGLRGAQTSRLTVIILPLTWLLAGMIGLNMPVLPNMQWLEVLSFVCLGVMVAFDLKLSALVIAALAGMYGALHGLLNGSALAAIGAGPSALFGIVLTVFIIALLTSATIVPLRGIWSRIVVRVAGSWVAAVGMLMFGWLMQGAS
jgi:hydrogenase/urease accessory protein HupE